MIIDTIYTGRHSVHCEAGIGHKIRIAITKDGSTDMTEGKYVDLSFKDAVIYGFEIIKVALQQKLKW
jgi:hypothetical protein